MVPFLLLLNAGVAQVAYAEDAAPAAPNVALDCKTGFTGKFADEPDHQNCKKVDPGYNKETDECAKGFNVNKFLSSEDATVNGVATKGQLFCRPDTKANLLGADTKAISNGIQILAGVQQGLNRLIWPVLVLIGGLMENDLIYGNGMEEKLRDVWIPIRNLVNILFVVVLVGLALYNVLGLSEDTTSIKSMLPKIVVGIIAVNFSFVAIKVVLDGVNVMTTAVFALPDQVGGGLANMTSLPPDQQSRLCAALEGTPFSQFDDQGDETIKQAKDLYIYRTTGMSKYNASLKAKALTEIKESDSVEQIKQKIAALDTAIAAGGGVAGATNKEFQTKIDAAQNADLCTGKKLNETGILFLNHYNSRNAAFAMALNMGKIVFYNDVDPKMAGNIGDGYEKLFTNTLFSMVLYLIYAVSFIALFVVLLGRLVVMWLSIAVSPILLLMLASSQVKEKMGGFSKLADQFVKNAIAPLLIALSMTVGWIMLKAVQALDMGSQLGSAGGSFIGNSVFKVNPTNGIPVASLNTLQDFMVALGVIAVVWIGVFAAAEGTIAEGATKWIKEKVETAGRFVGQLPFKHLPLIPINLPDHPHDSYTFSQLGHYIENLTHGNDNKLTELAGGKKNADESNLRDMHSESDLKNWFKNLQGGKNDLENMKYRNAITNWKKDNPGAVAEMEKTDEGKIILKNLATLEKSEKEEDRKKAAKAINDLTGVRGAKGDLPTSSTLPPPVAPTKPGEKAAATAPTAIKKDSDIGKKLVKDGEAAPASEARIKQVNDSKVAIDGEIKKTTTTPAEKTARDSAIKAQVVGIGQAFQQAGKGLPDTAELKTIFGANYDEVLKVFGDESALQVALQTPPTPPAAGPAAGGGTPPPRPPVATP